MTLRVTTPSTGHGVFVVDWRKDGMLGGEFISD
jgi:hypothetical protein